MPQHPVEEPLAPARADSRRRPRAPAGRGRPGRTRRGRAARRRLSVAARARGRGGPARWRGGRPRSRRRPSPGRSSRRSAGIGRWWRSPAAGRRRRGPRGGSPRRGCSARRRRSSRSAESRRRLSTQLPTVTWLAAWQWCSRRRTSLGSVPCAASSASRCSKASLAPSWSRRSCISRTTNGSLSPPKSGERRGGRAGRDPRTIVEPATGASSSPLRSDRAWRGPGPRPPIARRGGVPPSPRSSARPGAGGSRAGPGGASSAGPRARRWSAGRPPGTPGRTG